MRIALDRLVNHQLSLARRRRSRHGRVPAAWQLAVPVGSRGVPHRPTREEVLLVLTGALLVTLDGATTTLHPGDVALVSAHSELRVDAGPDGATARVASTPGLEAVTADGSRISPPCAA